jgi:hypothetical protein
MLALLATVAGSLIAGYSAYKILTTQKGRGRKLRDMEVLRRLNIPPKKQARVWTFLMALGIVLLTPGLALLLSSDPISGAGGYKSPSNLRASTSSESPVMVPPSEKLDKTPRTVEKGGSGSSGSPVFFSSSSGGRSSGGGGTSTEPSADEKVAEIDEPSQNSPAIDQAPDILEVRSAQRGPKIEREPEKTEKAYASEPLESKGDKGPEPRTAALIRAPPEEGSALEDEKRVLDGSDCPEEEPTPTKPQTATAVVDVGPEKKTAPEISRQAAASIDPEPESKTSQAQEGVMEDDAEIGEYPQGSDPLATGDLSETASTAEPFEDEVEVELAEPSPPTEAFEEGDGVDLTGPANASDGLPTGEAVIAAVPPAQTKTDGVKRLVFKEDPSRETESTGNLSGEGIVPPNESLLNLTETPLEEGTAGAIEGFSRSLEFGKEFDNFTMQFQPWMGTDRGGASKPVSIIEFEKIDLGSNFGGGFGLTPTSPI